MATMWMLALTNIVNELNDEECENMGNMHDERLTFIQKMQELQKLADDYCVFEGIGDVVDTLMGMDDEDESEDEEEDEEEEEEAEEQAARATREGMFVDSEEEFEWMCCFDSSGAPKNDRKSQRILAKYERRRSGRWHHFPSYSQEVFPSSIKGYRIHDILAFRGHNVVTLRHLNFISFLSPF